MNCDHEFEEALVHARIERGENDILCPLCETRTPISKGAASIRKQDHSISAALTAIQKIVDKNTERDVRDAK